MRSVDPTQRGLIAVIAGQREARIGAGHINHHQRRYNAE